MNRRTSVPDELNYPASGSVQEKLAFMLHYALLAPSVRNTQPWAFTLQEDAVELFADRKRALPVADPLHRELTISCGAALEHLVVAIRHFGHSADVIHCPSRERADHLASVKLGSRHETDTDDAMLFYALHRRTTDRKPFRRRAIPSDLLPDLLAEATSPMTSVKALVEVEQKFAVADLIAEAELIQGRDAGFRKEMAQWLSMPGDRRKDGIPPAARGLSTLGAIVESLLGRKVDLGPRRAAASHKLAASSPILFVISTPTDDIDAWLHAGRALARLLLRARAAGIFASFFSQPVQVEDTRRKLALLTGNAGFPQVVLRMGFGAQPDAVTPRRSVEDVIQ